MQNRDCVVVALLTQQRCLYVCGADAAAVSMLHDVDEVLICCIDVRCCCVLLLFLVQASIANYYVLLLLLLLLLFIGRWCRQSCGNGTIRMFGILTPIRTHLILCSITNTLKAY